MKKLIESHNPGWKAEFEKIEKALRTELSDLPIDIQHVGSTSVTGVSAKPILDIDIIIEDKSLLDEVSATLEKTGYIAKGEQGIKGRFAFRQSSESTPLTAQKVRWQPHHLYVCFSDSTALKNHLLFRDILRNNADLAGEYSALKQSLTENTEISKENYTVSKTAFILSVLTSAGLDETALKQIKDANTHPSLNRINIAGDEYSGIRPS